MFRNLTCRVPSALRSVQPHSFLVPAAHFHFPSFRSADGASAASPASSAQPKPHSRPSVDMGSDYLLPHPIWAEDYVSKIDVTHKPVDGFSDRLALLTIKILRNSFDFITGYNRKPLNDSRFLTRMIFLETVAAVPGAVAGTVRTLRSLRRMKRDHGWIHTMFEEAENERMHLLTALHLKNPGLLFRAGVFLTQALFFNFYWIAYVLSPKYCHRMVGYLEEEAVKTYTHALAEISAGKFWKDTPAPPIGVNYWKLKPNATMYDLIQHVRADEAHHREVNHTLASIPSDATNPYLPGH